MPTVNWTLFPPPTPSVCVMGHMLERKAGERNFRSSWPHPPRDHGQPPEVHASLWVCHQQMLKLYFLPSQALPHSLITCSPITPKSESQNPTLVSGLGSRVDLPPAYAKQNCSIVLRIASPCVFLVSPSTDAETPSQETECVFSPSASLSLSGPLLSWTTHPSIFFCFLLPIPPSVITGLFSMSVSLFLFYK